jgi:hypothetical protein
MNNENFRLLTETERLQFASRLQEQAEYYNWVSREAMFHNMPETAIHYQNRSAAFYSEVRFVMRLES